MPFRFYSTILSQASRRLAGGMFLAGLGLISFGLLVYWLRDIFAFIAAGLFVFVGLGCAVTAVKIYFAQRRLDKMSNRGNEGRENVRIRFEEHYDI